MSGSAEIIRADALALPLEDQSVDLVVTSPPYFGLRSYQDNGQHYAGQIGDEATPAEFVDALIAATAEMVRVLKPEGSIWVNLGDKYSRGSRPCAQPDQFSDGDEITYEDPRYLKRMEPENTGIAGKSLIGVPWRYAIRCIDELGLILRAEVIWAKPNGLPESVTDRVRRSHETWFHFTKSPRYFSAVDEIREAYLAPTATRTFGKVDPSRGDHGQPTARKDAVDVMNPLGKLPGSVWTIPTQSLIVPEELGVDHFAAFPMEWPRRIIRGWSPEGVCVACGQGRRPVSVNEVTKDRGGRKFNAMEGKVGALGLERVYTITGYACGCDEPTADTTSAVVLDPFGGTGTTATVAKALGRHGISVDLSADYCRLAEWRTNDPGELAKAAELPKPKPVPDGQEVLFP